MRKALAGLVASGALAAGLFVGAGSASATVTYTCTRKANDRTATVKVTNDRSEDYLEAHGFVCTGD